MPSFILEIDPTTLAALRSLRADKVDARHDFDAARGTPVITAAPASVPTTASIK